MANRNIERAVRVALLTAGAVSVGAYSSGVLAQAAPTGPTPDEVEQIIVTGSRIPQPNLEGTSPVTMVGQQEVKLEGTMQVESLINNLPMAFADQGGNISNGASGTATINLRNLGSNRTLVLVNGRRLPAGSPRGPVAPDINFIPAALIKRVEVLTGGAGAVYGSDAVAGVVNFIMIDDFEGVQFDGNYSGYQHNNDDNFMRGIVADAGYPKAPGSVWDGESYSLSMTMGSNFADGKGNATVFFGYSHTDALLQSERDSSACALAWSTTAESRYCGGSGTSYPGSFRVGNITPTGLPRAGSTNLSMNFDLPPGSQIIPFGVPYNYGPLNYYQRPQDRYQFAAFAHYDLTDSAQVYGEFMFMDNSTVAQIAPSGAFGVTATIGCNNPLLQQDNAQWYNRMCVDPVAGTLTSRNLTLLRRNVEGGGRQDDIELTQYRGVIGVKGSFAEHWNYDVSGQYGTVVFAETYNNDFSITRLGRSLDVVTDPDTGLPACASFVDGSDPNCVPWNIWTQDGVTPQSLNYVSVPGFQRGNTTQTVVDATVSSNLGDYGITLPTAQDGIGLAFGAEYRQEGLSLDTDLEFQSGDLAGQGGPTLPVSGEYNVMDYFAEVRVPLVQDMPFAKDLTFNGSYRYSDYSTDVNTSTYGMGLDWSIIDDVKLRGSYQHAVRAPNVIELFTPSGLGLFDMSRDPCGTRGVNPPSASLAACVASGLDPVLYGTDLDSPAGQYNAIFGGNTQLSPEKADTWTVGIVFTPTFLEGFSMTVDYWNIKVDDTIASVPPDVTLDQCLATLSPVYCSQVTRDADGTLWLHPEAQIIATNINIGSLETSGVDVNANYVFSMTDWGSLNFAFIGTYLDEFISEPLPGVVKYDCAGLYGTTCGTPAPTWRSKFRTTWNTPWNVDLSLNWRYFGDVKVDGTSSNPDLNSPNEDFGPVNHIDAQNYFDLAAVFTFAENYTLNAGINNILDEVAPISPFVGTGFGNGNTYPQVYDALGRYAFVGLTVKF